MVPMAPFPGIPCLRGYIFSTPRPLSVSNDAFLLVWQIALLRKDVILQ